MSKKRDDANQKAFERGQSDWREGKDANRSNPYHPDSDYHQSWQQGWEQEDDLQRK